MLSIRTSENGDFVFDLFDSIEEWLESEVKDNDQT